MSDSLKIILYLSYFYKHSELSIRLGYFWTGMNIADIVSSFLAYGLLHMRGVAGQAGWRWLFMIEVSGNPLINGDTLEHCSYRYFHVADDV